ncbi:MAG TPA: RT0821/Lpp0805 family surface protein [Stellaceae bacterium]|nr:RT0821/Lpp0805 family surface protein [Stellaceae bacterium]
MSGGFRFLARAVPFEAIAAGLLLLWPVDALAQFSRSSHTTVQLTSSDRVIIRKIVREDFTDKPNGTTIAWSNPESTNSGTVTLLDRFSSKGRDCRRVRYDTKPGPKQPASVRASSYVLTSCRLADGTWKLDSQARPDKSP